MRSIFAKHAHGRLPLAILSLAVLLGVALGVLVITFAHASTPLTDPGPGFLDFSYGPDTGKNITGDKPESKLWWNDGFWWGSLFNPTAGDYHIYRLDWGEQDWVDTGVALDDRPESRADVLWDGQHLYVVSHLYTEFSKKIAGSDNWGRLYRYSYDEPTQTYAVDLGFPVTINEDQSEALVLDKDSTGRLWTAFVSREADNQPYQVYINATNGDDQGWNTRFALTSVFTQAEVSSDDIASIISFRDDDGDKIGVMWSNQLTTTLSLNFASHLDSNLNYETGWSLTSVPVPLANPADDHISIKSLKKTSSGQLFAVIKTNATGSTEALILLVARDTNGDFSFHTYSTKAANDTRPILLVNEDSLANASDDKLYVFVTGKPGGSKICYKELAITNPLSSMGDFLPIGDCGIDFIESNTYNDVDNATSTKQNVNEDTGLVILASDDITDHVYVHNKLGDPPPVVTSRSPGINETDVSAGAVVTATFSRQMLLSTINASNFTVEDGSGPLAGTVSYDSLSLTATFTPSGSLNAETEYTVTLNSSVQDTLGRSLFGAPEVWSFTTAPPTVQFSDASYSVGEGMGSAVITVSLSTTSDQTIEVNYATSDGTAQAGSDYAAVSNTLTISAGAASGTFSVPITDDLDIEGPESLNLALSDPVNASLGSPYTATLEIVDNDGPPTIQFGASSFDVSEGAGSATISVTLSHSFTDPVTVTYATSDDTAVAGSDYTAVSDALTFSPGDTLQTFSVPITDDSMDEPVEAISLTLTNPVNGSLGILSDAKLNIVDNDGVPTVQFGAANYSVDEDAGNALVEVTLSNMSSEPITVTYTSSNGTALAGLDYIAVNNTLTFSSGELSKTFTVPILPDSLHESDETVNLALSNPVNAGLGVPVEAVLTIKDVTEGLIVYLPLITK